MLPVERRPSWARVMDTIMDPAEHHGGAMQDDHAEQESGQAQGGHAASQDSPDPLPDTDEAHIDSCFSRYGLEVILLQLALGLSLASSESTLATLPREVMQHHVARHVRVMYMDDLGDRGLLTPVEMSKTPDVFDVFTPRALSREPPALVRRVRVRRDKPIFCLKRRLLHVSDFSPAQIARPDFLSLDTEADTHAETTTAHAPASVPALAANPPPAPTPPSTPLRKRQLHAGGTVSVPAPSAPKRPKYIAKAGPIEVTRAEMAPLVRALQRPRGPSDNVNALVGATIGYLLATPLAYRSLVYRSVAM